MAKTPPPPRRKSQEFMNKEALEAEQEFKRALEDAKKAGDKAEQTADEIRRKTLRPTFSDDDPEMQKAAAEVAELLKKKGPPP